MAEPKKHVDSDSYMSYAKGGKVEKVKPKRRAYEQGGAVAGLGGPTSDSVPANLSNGEYVIPAHVVHLLGTAFFDKVVQQAEARLGAGGGGTQNPFAELAANEMGEMTPGTGM